MDNQSAINFMEKYLDNEVYTNKCIAAHSIAIAAINKRIPVKPLMTEDKQFLLCPSCNGKGLKYKQKFCDECGQAIDTSDE